MNSIQLLAEWAVRSSVLILCGCLLLRMWRVKDPSIIRAACIAMAGGSLILPALKVALPSVPLRVMRAPASISRVAIKTVAAEAAPVDWQTAAITMYFIVCGIMLLRLSTGLVLSQRLRGRSRATGETTGGIEILESDRVASPVTLGIARPAIVLPNDWREWDRRRLGAVLAHERSHIQRYDPAVQVLSAIHRALLWHSPLSWYLHRCVVQACEQASDDAAVLAAGDRVFYAEVLLDFMQRGMRWASWHGVPMARYGRADERIHRILDATVLSRGVTRRGVAVILLAGASFTYAVAAAQPQRVAAPNEQTRAYFVHGEVRSPGSFALTYPTTVLRALVEAGGFLESANTKEIRIVRREGGKVTEFRFRYEEVKTGKNPAQNIWLKPGDEIIVP
uniref:Peptidase M56, BlaR1 n=1 Tax=Solibacter usitatus (strain Ellin6076) TaxID=234267 RepID=Q023Z3_SOLUE